ncbi:MAG: restriction endonuclease [Acutalibacteraceae bacterium]
MLKTLLNVDTINAGLPSNIKGQEFEWFLYYLFLHAGYKVYKLSQEGRDDDKKDLIIELDGTKIAIQSKNYRLDGTNIVDKDIVTSFAGAIEGEDDISCGVVITTHFFTQNAIEWCKRKEGKPIKLIDRKKLPLLIAKLYPELLAAAYYEKDTADMGRCKKCGSITINKNNKKTGETFKGCVRYPNCK